MEFPERVRVVIQVPRWSFVKRRDDGGVDFVAPLPSPFNYGSVPGTVSGDGDRLDAIVLGPRLGRGSEVERRVLDVVGFLDAGEDDPKLICGEGELGSAERASVERFFRRYARAKRLLNWLRGRRGPTAFEGWVRSSEGYDSAR